MKRISIFLLIFCGVSAHAQIMRKPSALVIATLPEWAQRMYGTDPNVFEVDRLYTSYYAAHPFIPTSHTRYHQFWRKENAAWVNDSGFIRKPLPGAGMPKARNLAVQSLPTVQWTLVGPDRTVNADQSKSPDQTNVYSISQCLRNPSVVYCGTEPGEIYKSTNAGQQWNLVTLNDPLNGGVTALCVHPQDPNHVLAGSGDYLFRSTDGGGTWQNVLTVSGLGVNEIHRDSLLPSRVWVASNKGFWVSTDNAASFQLILPNACYDVKTKPSNPQIVYVLQNNPGLDICSFYKSTDGGFTFSSITNGWYSSTDPNRSDGGARLAVTPANPNRVYAYLVGAAKANDYGFIGVYRSDDSGNSWQLPNGPAGGPYTTAHPNLAYGNPNWTYDQGFYNCALMANPNNADQILIGGLNLWRSNDGGQTFSSVAGYIGGPLNMHVDNQDFRVGVGGCWITNDGGINFSTDFYQTQPQILMNGVHGSEFWAFGTGWNEDVMVGGLYHNGTIAHHENYGDGVFLALGGGEPASGYVNPGNNKKVYSSDIGAVTLPGALPGNLSYGGVGMWPNESYWAAEASEMKFHPVYYNRVFIGRYHRLYKSEDGGATYSLLRTFGSDSLAPVSYIEIGTNNPNVMFVAQRPSSGLQGRLWKSTNGGQTWSQLTLPAGNSRRMVMSINPSNSDELWLGFPSAGNGQKVYRSTNGGATWTNQSNALFNNQEVRWILSIGQTQGGVFLFTTDGAYYRNNNTVWADASNGLPAYVNALYGRPFYRDGKVRLATYGRGVWEAALPDAPQTPLAQAMVDKPFMTQTCLPDSFHFEDHSILNHSGASWQWSFPGGSPSTSTLRNPAVYYAGVGTYQATLVVQNAAGNSDTSQITVGVQPYVLGNTLSEGFEGNFPPAGWWNTSTGNFAWARSTAAGGYQDSNNSLWFDNYSIDCQGAKTDFHIRFNAQAAGSNQVFFDHAYAIYGFPYSDTLQVWAYTNCGANGQLLFSKGGNDLATAPALTSGVFVPTASQWKTDTLELGSLANSTDLELVFRNVGRYGQALYVDNVLLPTLTARKPRAVGTDLLMAPNPLSRGDVLRFVQATPEPFAVEVWNSEGQLQWRENVAQGKQSSLDTHRLAAGMYLVVYESATRIETQKLVVR